jgi:hypothetical protein
MGVRRRRSQPPSWSWKRVMVPDICRQPEVVVGTLAMIWDITVSAVTGLRGAGGLSTRPARAEG